MTNYYLYIQDNKWNYCDSVFSGIATLRPDCVSGYCLSQAEEMRHSDLGNYDHLSKEQREELAKRWEAAIELPEGKYEYYFNLDDKYKMFKKAVKEIAKSLGIDYKDYVLYISKHLKDD